MTFYRFPDDIAAVNFLSGITPRQLLGNLAGRRRIFTGEGGVLRLFERMVETEDIPVIYRTNVDVRLKPFFHFGN